MFKDKLVDGDDVDGRNRNDDNHSSHPLSYIPPQSTTSYTKKVKRRGHQDGQTD
jgi:hypothetical protein